MLKCIEVQDNLIAFLKEELAEGERIRIQSHLRECGQCRQARSETDKLRGLFHLETSPAVSGGVWARLAESIKSEKTVTVKIRSK
ncbi:MAG: zf-HC2 domain-containing protein [Planctomycetes bacterium]|nr:zf-HC2 domain-containing protein [Planctomycetota bacterium]